MSTWPSPSVDAPAPSGTLRRSLAAWLALGLLAMPAQAGNVLHVPADVSSIQAAIATATDGDRIEVAPGTYHEALDFLGKDLVVVGTGGAALTIIDATGLGTSVVSFVSMEPASALLEGFTLTGGTGREIGNISRGGGGVLFGGDVAATVAECVITGNALSAALGNTAGGGVLSVGSDAGSPRLLRCTITGNTAGSPGSNGGGIASYFLSGAHGLSAIDCDIGFNTSMGGGGGIFNCDAMTGSVIHHNTSGKGGGVCFTVSADPEAKDALRCTITDNVATQTGGALYYSVPYAIYPQLDFERCLFARNTAPLGGGVHIEITPSNTKPMRFRTCAFTGNVSTGAGSGLYFKGDTPVVLENCTASGNSLRMGTSKATIRNTIVAGAPGLLTGVFLTVSYSDVQGGIAGTGNIDADPLFVDATAGDLHLLPGSPCRNAGDPALAVSLNALDLEGEPRLLEGAFDIGADELLDCNGNEVLDHVEIAAGAAGDCNLNHVPDECEYVDCNANGQNDACDVAMGLAPDCDGNFVPDDCESGDCNGNGILDGCDIASGFSHDCNENHVPDECDIANGVSEDIDQDGYPDECQVIIEVPQEAPDIRTALTMIDVPKGSIVVDDGVWTGPGNTELFNGPGQRAIVSRHGPANCIIDGGGFSAFMRIHGEAGNGLLFRGFTFTKCQPVLALDGGVSPVVEDCLFIKNSILIPGLGGAGIQCLQDSRVECRRCVFVANKSTLGGALLLGGSGGLIESCTFIDNSATGNGGSIRVQGGADVVLRSCIFRGGKSAGGKELSMGTAGSTLDVAWCDVAGGQAGVQVLNGVLTWGPGNINLDPLFVDATAGDYHLMPGSPCNNTGDPGAPLDSDGSPVEMGAFRYDAWTDLGGGVAGGFGMSTLECSGSLLGDHAVDLLLQHVRPASTITIFVGLSAAEIPFHGGVFWPASDIALTGLHADASGALASTGRWPLGLPSAFSIYLQAWFPDSQAAGGLAGSNGVLGITP